jgi:hypothetical protein
MDFTRLECRDILAHIGAGIDPDVLAKIQQGAEQRAMPTTLPAGYLPSTTLAPPEAPAGVVPPVPLVLDEKATKAGWTAETIAAANEAQQRSYENYLKGLKRPANLNPDDALNADFAGPDAPAEARRPVARHKVGEINEAEDKCVKIDDDGNSVYVCSKSGHGYTYNPYVLGCPICFAAGAGGVRVGGGEAVDEDRIAGEEDF